MGKQEWEYEPGYIVRAKVPHTDSSWSDSRYPVIVSSRSYNQQYPEVIVAFTTRSSNINHPRSYDVEISNKHKDFKLTGLPENTTVRCGRLHTIKKSFIYDAIGIVPDDLMVDINKIILECFGNIGS